MASRPWPLSPGPLSRGPVRPAGSPGPHSGASASTAVFIRRGRPLPRGRDATKVQNLRGGSGTVSAAASPALPPGPPRALRGRWGRGPGGGGGCAVTGAGGDAPRAPVGTRPARRSRAPRCPLREDGARPALGTRGRASTPAMSLPWNYGSCLFSYSASLCVSICFCTDVYTHTCVIRKKSLKISGLGFSATVRVGDPLVPTKPPWISKTEALVVSELHCLHLCDFSSCPLVAASCPVPQDPSFVSAAGAQS